MGAYGTSHDYVDASYFCVPRRVDVLRDVDRNAQRVVDVAAGGAFTLATTADGSVVSWGWAAYGVLGIATPRSYFVLSCLLNLLLRV